MKLRENSTAKISALKDELSTCRNESEQLKLKVTEIQDQLKVQGEVLAVRVDIHHPDPLIHGFQGVHRESNLFLLPD